MAEKACSARPHSYACIPGIIVIVIFVIITTMVKCNEEKDGEDSKYILLIVGHQLFNLHIYSTIWKM